MAKQDLNNGEANVSFRGKLNAMFTELYTAIASILTQAAADGRYVRTVNGTAPDGSGNVAVAGGVGGATNLTATASPTGVLLASDTGADATLPLADGTNAGLMAPAQVTKLAGVSAGATANATDDQLRDRSTHTGTQLAATISDFSTAADARVAAAAGVSVASLSGGKIPAAQLPDIAISDYLGAAANQAAMLALTGQKGDWCTRTDLGTTWVITGADPGVIGGWTQLSYPVAPVTSVAGRTGAVTLAAADVGLTNAENKSFAVGMGDATAAATTKATPVDEDVLPISDSAASNGLKKLSWANLKVTLKAYLDTLYQAALVSGTNIKTVNGASVLGTGDLVVGGATTLAGLVAAGGVNQSLARSNYIIGMGDSNMIGQGGYATGLVNALCGRSQGRFRYLYNAGAGGATSTVLTKRVYRDVISKRPGFCLLMQGTNDIGSISAAASVANDALAIKALRAAGIVVLYCPVYPHNASPSGALSVNAAKASYAATLNDPGVIWLDFFSQIGNADGTWKTGYNGDNVHITVQSTRIVVDWILAQTSITSILSGLSAPRVVPGDLANPIANGTFDQGSAVAGLGAGWALSSSTGITASIVAPTAGENLLGNWQQLVITPGNSASLSYAVPVGTMNAWAGRRVGMVCRLATSGADAAAAANVGGSIVNMPSFAGITFGGTNVGSYDYSNDTFYFEGVLPLDAGLANSPAYGFGIFMANPSVSPGNLTVRIGEVGVFLLNDDGLVVNPGVPVRTVQYTSLLSVYADDGLILSLPNGANITATLPNANTCTGRTKTLKRTDNTSGAWVLLQGTASQTIDGLTTYRCLTSQYESITVQSTGGAWVVVAQSPRFLAKVFTSNAAMTPDLPAKGRITSVTLIETAGQAAGDISLGTTAAGTDIANAVTLGANGVVTLTDAQILKRMFSTTAAQTLYVSSSAWGTSSVSVRIGWELVP